LTTFFNKIAVAKFIREKPFLLEKLSYLGKKGAFVLTKLPLLFRIALSLERQIKLFFYFNKKI